MLRGSASLITLYVFRFFLYLNYEKRGNPCRVCGIKVEDGSYHFYVKGGLRRALHDDDRRTRRGVRAAPTLDDPPYPKKHRIVPTSSIDSAARYKTSLLAIRVESVNVCVEPLFSSENRVQTG